MLAASDSPRTSNVTRSREAGEVHRGLPGRVAAADDRHALTGERRRLRRRGAVEDAGAVELPRGAGMPSRRYDTPVAMTTARPAISVPSASVTTRSRRRRGEADDGVAVDHLGAEQDRLLERPGGQLGAADPTRETEIVADHRAGAGLAAHRDRLDERGAQSLRLGVHRGGEPGRSTADDDDVVDHRRRDAVRGAERVGDVDVGRVDERSRRSAARSPVTGPPSGPLLRASRARVGAGRSSVNGMSWRWRRSQISETRGDRSGPTMQMPASAAPCRRHHSSRSSTTLRWNRSSGEPEGRVTKHSTCSLCERGCDLFVVRRGSRSSCSSRPRRACGCSRATSRSTWIPLAR